MSEKNKVPRKGLGVVIGVAIGAIVGFSLQSYPIGMGVGLVFAFGLEKAYQRNREQKDDHDHLR